MAIVRTRLSQGRTGAGGKGRNLQTARSGMCCRQLREGSAGARRRPQPNGAGGYRLRGQEGASEQTRRAKAAGTHNGAAQVRSHTNTGAVLV